MRPLDLDYAPRPAWASRSGLLALAGALAIAAAVFKLHRQETQALDAGQARWQQLERSQKRLVARSMPGGSAPQEMQAEIRRANEVTAQLDLPWSPLFQAVEAASHETVALLGIQPDAQKRTVSITAESKDMGSALDYVKRLGQDPLLVDVHIVNHQVQEQEPEKPLRFSVQAVWRERKRDK